jgi:hypothetical protein
LVFSSIQHPVRGVEDTTIDPHGRPVPFVVSSKGALTAADAVPRVLVVDGIGLSVPNVDGDTLGVGTTANGLTGRPPGSGTPIVAPKPVVLSAVAPSGIFPPAKADAAPNDDVSPSGPAPAEGVDPQPESVGSTEDAISLVEVAMVPLPANIEPVPNVPTPGFGPAPGHVGLEVVGSVGDGLRPPAKSSAVPRGIPAPPIEACVLIPPIGDGLATLSDGSVEPAFGVLMSGRVTCASPAPLPSKAAIVTIMHKRNTAASIQFVAK